MSDELRIGVIGAGSIAGVAIPGFDAADGVSVVAVGSRRSEQAEELVGRLGIGHAVDDPRRILDDAAIDLVYVATPPRSHHDQVLEVVAAGKHVLCEKQFAMTSDEAKAMVVAATEAGVVHAITHPTRYTPALLRARKAVRDGVLGIPQVIDIAVLADYAMRPTMQPYYDHWSSRRAQGGGLRDYVCHHIDHLRFLFGDVEVVGAATSIAKTSKLALAPGVGPTEIAAGSPPTLGTVPSDAYDTAVMCGRLLAGGLVSLAASWAVIDPSGVEWRMYGSEGTMHLSGSAFPSRLEGGRRGDEPTTLLSAPVPGQNPYTLLAADLRRAVADDGHEATFATFHDGLRLQEILDQLVEP